MGSTQPLGHQAGTPACEWVRSHHCPGPWLSSGAAFWVCQALQVCLGSADSILGGLSRRPLPDTLNVPSSLNRPMDPFPRALLSRWRTEEAWEAL